MKASNYLLYLLLSLFMTATSCVSKEESKGPGTIAVVFDHKADDNDLSLRIPGDMTYDYTDANGQQYNISKFGYYISGIKFIGPSGIGYGDPNKITADASKLTGFYQVLESDPASQIININSVTVGTYDKITFTIGIKAYTVIEGTPGGILDPGTGAWFLNMEAGYVNLAIEGNAANSGQKYVPKGTETEVLEGTFSVQISGWKDVAAEPGQNPVFVDNTKTIELDFDELLSVEEGLNPAVHINVNLVEILEGIDFSQTFDVKGPSQGTSFSNKFNEAFKFGFVTQ